MKPNVDAKLDLVLEKTTDLKPEVVWKALTTPELIKQWGCPKPWKVIESEIDLRPGGINKMVMQSPEGQTFPGNGCFLEVITGKKLVWTNALLPGFRPSPPPKTDHEFSFTAVVTVEPHGSGTKYTAVAMHATEAARETHEKMGFVQGWGICFDQLVEVAKSL